MSKKLCEKVNACKNSNDKSVKTLEFNCDVCAFNVTIDADFRGHIRTKHEDSRKFFKSRTCDIVCRIKLELTDHNDKYLYSHRMALNSKHKKYILEEFELKD